MDCPSCPARMIVFEVPPDYLDYAPDGAEFAALCPECLTLAAAPAEAPAEESFERMGAAFPLDEAAVPMALAVGLLDSLALNRQSIEALLTHVERAGVDPLLVLDRLASQGSVQPAFDLRRRRHQLEQLRG